MNQVSSLSISVTDFEHCWLSCCHVRQSLQWPWGSARWLASSLHMCCICLASQMVVFIFKCVRNDLRRKGNNSNGRKCLSGWKSRGSACITAIYLCSFEMQQLIITATSVVVKVLTYSLIQLSYLLPLISSFWVWWDRSVLFVLMECRGVRGSVHLRSDSSEIPRGGRLRVFYQRISCFFFYCGVQLCT